jgi:hypothetical protein
MSASPIDAYLDELFRHVRDLEPAEARRLLSETEAHLRDAADDAERGGMSRDDAERRAVERFGAAGRIARAERWSSGGTLAPRVVVSAWQVGAIGAVAIGVSGLIAGVMYLLGASDSFLAGGESTSHLSAADCSRWLAIYPHAPSCAVAALRDWTAETIYYRVGVGVVGVLALLALVVVRHRWTRARQVAPLPNLVVDSVATTCFVIAGVWLAGLGADALIVSSGRGAGGWLSAAPVSLAVGLAFAFRLRRDLGGQRLLD